MSNLKYKVGDVFDGVGEYTKNTITIDHIGELTDEYYITCPNEGFKNGYFDDEWIDEYYKQVINFKVNINEQVGGNHYDNLEIDPYHYSMVNKLNPLQMNAIKYITRYLFKNGIEDLEKAKHTINRLIEYEKNNNKK